MGLEKNDDLDEMYETTRAKGFGNEVKRRLMIGTCFIGDTMTYYLKALKVRKLISNDFKEAFDRCDLILHH